MLLASIAFALVMPTPALASMADAAHAGDDSREGMAADRALPPTVIGMLAAAIVAILLIHRYRLLRLTRAPVRAEPVSPAGAIAAAVGLLLAGQVGVIVAARLAGIELGEAAPRDLRTEAILVWGFAAPQLLGAIVWIVAARRAQTYRFRQRRDPVAFPRALVEGLGALAVAWPLVAVVAVLAGELVEAVGGPARRTVGHETLRMLQEGGGGAWSVLVVLQAAFVAPVVEEVLYRACLQGGLGRVVGRWPAIVIVASAFAFMHVSIADPGAVAALFCLGVGFGVVYERTGRLSAPIVMHAGFNVLNLMLAAL